MMVQWLVFCIIDCFISDFVFVFSDFKKASCAQKQVFWMNLCCVDACSFTVFSQTSFYDV